MWNIKLKGINLLEATRLEMIGESGNGIEGRILTADSKSLIKIVDVRQVVFSLHEQAPILRHQDFETRLSVKSRHDLSTIDLPAA